MCSHIMVDQDFLWEKQHRVMCDIQIFSCIPKLEQKKIPKYKNKV